MVNAQDKAIAITPNDIAALQKIEPRKSVLNFTAEELSSTSTFAEVLNADINKKSPYFRAENGEWRDSDEHTVPIIEVKDRKSDFKSVRADIKSQSITRGGVDNIDTGWKIAVSRNGLEDTVKYGFKHGDPVIYNALYYVKDIVENGVLLDTVTSENNKNSKAFNSEFMHKFYGVFRFKGECYLAKLAVEEFPDANLKPMRRLYNLQDIKIEPLRHIGFENNSLSRSILNGSNISIAHLFEIVKGVDKDFYKNKKKTLVLNDGRESMDNKQSEIKSISAEISITVSNQNGTNNTFDVTSVGFDTGKRYTVAEFNQALKNANEKWQENWDGLSYPSNIVIVTVENLHNEPCSYRINLTDADYNSIQDIVDLLPTPMHASISTEKAIEKLNNAETVADEQDKTFAYKTGARSEPFTVVVLDIRSEERKAALSYALNSIINSGYYKSNPDQALPYKDLLEMAEDTDKYMHVSQGHLSCLKYALRQSNENELCSKMLDGIHYAENNISKENEYREPYQLGDELNKAIRTTMNKAEHIPQRQDISHKTNNSAVLSAAKANGHKRSIIMSNNTKLSVSSMTISDDENSAIKAFAAVTVNDEFAIKNIKVIEGNKGLFVAMPNRKSGNEYSDVVFPITKEAREQLNATVIDCYNDMQSKGQERFMADNTPPEKSVSTITASIHPQDYENSHVKGTGQIVIDGAFVVSGVKVVEGKDGQIFASMPSYTNDVDERKDYAFPITKECYEKVQNAVLEDYAYIQNYHEMGGKENLSTAYNLSASFADKLSEELNKQGIENLVKKSDGRANITVKLEDKDKFAEIRKDFAQKLQQEKDGGKKSLSQRIEKAKAQQPDKAAEQTPAKQPHKKPNSQEL